MARTSGHLMVLQPVQILLKSNSTCSKSQAVAEEVATMDKYSVRFVPVTWFGVASEVGSQR